MKFETPAGKNPIDRMQVVGRPLDRVDGPLKTGGLAPYAFERHDVAANQAYGYVVGAAIATGRIVSIDASEAERAPGVITVVKTTDMASLGLGFQNWASLFGGPIVQHYHQAVAIVVAETFEKARAAAGLVRVEYARGKGSFDLEVAARGAPLEKRGENVMQARHGDFETAFADAPVTLDATYTTPDQSHAMMEPHATIAAWNGDQLTLWTSHQVVRAAVASMSQILGIQASNIRIDSPYVGGGFGGKLFMRADAVCAALAAKAAKRPVKLTLQRPLIINNTTHRPATIQRIRLGAARDGRLLAIGHESTSGNVVPRYGEAATEQTKLLYASENRFVARYLAQLDLPEGNAMRAPGEASGHMALEVAMDELAEKLGMDPIELRVVNDTQVDPMNPDRPFSQRQLVECLRTGAQRFGWSRRNPVPGRVHDGRWLVGMGVASGLRNNLQGRSGARVRLDAKGRVTVETDMTDIGTGSYTIIAQTAAEMMGVDIAQVTVRLGDSAFPAACGSGGQFGANNSTAGVYAACVKLREAVAQKLGFATSDVVFENGNVLSGARSVTLASVAADGEMSAEDAIEYGDLGRKYQQSTFAGHFVEVGVDRYTGEIRVRRMLAVCAAGRILNPKTARSQVIGAMTMGVGAALMEELAIDKRFGFFVNHDLAGYEVPVHADIPHQDVIFLDEVDPLSSPMKAKGVGELGLCGVSAAIANAVYNATGVRVREYPLTLDKYLHRLSATA